MKNFPLFPILLSMIAFSCSESKKKINESVMEMNSPLPEKVTFYQLDHAAAFPDAILELHAPLSNERVEPGKVSFEFNIKNFPFKQTADTDPNPKLHLVLNGSDPIGFFSHIFQKELPKGSYHLVAYLVDQEGLALKNYGNYLSRDFVVGNGEVENVSGPDLILNYPRNKQTIPEGDELIVDFLVSGGDIGQNRMKVRIRINDCTYETDHMAPIRIANLPIGDYQVKTQLLQADGTEIEAPYSSVSRTIFVR